MTESVLFAGRPVCVVGNINRDVKVQSVPAAAALFKDGETSVPSIIETIGGGGANSACAAAALGGSVRFVGKVGSDALGARLPNNETLRFEDLDLAALDGCTHLLRADVWFSEAMLAGGNLHLFNEARRRGIATSLDLNFDPCWSTGAKEAIARRKELLRETLSLVDLAHGNVRELCEFTDSPDVETALKRLTVEGVKAVVVHLGSRGAGFWAEGKLTIEPPSPAHAVVNSTGTGDVLSICMILLHARTDLSIQEKLHCSNQVVSEFMEGKRTLIPAI
jgi:sugar/nucleoside kinase (ribokinase family)